MDEKKEKITLTQAREKAGLSKSEVCRRVYVSRSRLIKYEQGEVRPSYAILGLLCDLYGVDPTDLDIWTPDYFKHSGTKGFRP